MNRAMLEAPGYRVVEETDPVRAVETFRKDDSAFDLVITDKTVPHLTGFDVIEEIRRIRPGMPVILCSGFQEKEDSGKIKALGNSQLLGKPVNMSDMSRAIRQMLAGKD